MDVLSKAVVLITGAGRGIGRCCAEAMAKKGARLAIVDLDREAADQCVEDLGGEARAFSLDIGDAEAFERCVAKVEAALGPVRILVNNAGVMHVGAMESLDTATEERMLRTNLLGVMNGVRAVRPSMRSQGGGLVVNLASLVARIPLPYTAVYSATKAGVAGLTEALRLELHDEGIRFMGVYPGYVRTELTAGVPLPRFPRAVTPEQVAEGLIRGIEAERASVYVPASGRYMALLRPLIPLRLTRVLGGLSGTMDLFNRIDSDQREAYRSRTGRVPPE
jgi:short-subunit dehydrogenase